LGDDGAIFATDVSHDEDDSDDDDVIEGLSLSAQTKAALKKSQKQRIRKGSSGRNSLGSNIYFHRFKTFAHQRDKDWYLTLPDGEHVLGCACGSGWAAVATR
jgi:Minichromosome loss protein, Mcl1, middle region